MKLLAAGAENGTLLHVWFRLDGRNFHAQLCDGEVVHIEEADPPCVQPEIPFADCENPDCPVGCPDSHCVDYGADQ